MSMVLEESAAPAGERHVLQVECFGGFRIVGAPDNAQPKRGRMLLQYLVLHAERRVSRDRLFELLWPELDSEALQHRLHLAVSGARAYLRTVLDGCDAIRCGSDGYAWNPTVQVECDVDRFAGLYRAGTIAALEAAVALYHGELYEGDEQDWIAPARVKYATMYAFTLQRLAEAAFERADLESALGYGLRLIEFDRAHEGATRIVMRCFGALGRRTQAIAAYDALSMYLQRRLGVEPMLETTGAMRAIIGAKPAIATGADRRR